MTHNSYSDIPSNLPYSTRKSNIAIFYIISFSKRIFILIRNLRRILTYFINVVAQFCGNIELCRLTEQVVFSDPYNKTSQCNRWTSPYLDHDVEALQKDDDLKIEIAELKSLYVVIS